MDIRCVRLVAYDINGKNYLDIEQVIPLGQAADYQVQIRKKDQQQEKVRLDNRDWTRYQIIVDGEPGPLLNKHQAGLTMKCVAITAGPQPPKGRRLRPPPSPVPSASRGNGLS